jgi:hypothetical protein
MLFVACGNTLSEKDSDDKGYIGCVKEFYQALFEHPNASTIMGFNIKDRNALTQGLSEDEIYKIVDKASVESDGWDEMIMKLVILTFSENIQVYFEVYREYEKPVYKINYFFLANGKDFFDESLYRPGMVKRKEGIVYSHPSLESSKVREFNRDTFFFFTPMYDSDWVIISKEFNGDPIGYMLKKDIIKFEQFPERKKEEVRTYLLDHIC